MDLKKVFIRVFADGTLNILKTGYMYRYNKLDYHT